MRVEYYSVDTKEGSTNITEGNRSLSVETGKQFSIRVANSAIFSETETVLLPTLSVTTGSYKGQALVGYITEISADTLTVIPVNADSTPATFDLKVGDPVVRMGRAARELDVQTTQFIALPRKDYNFCQIFKSQVEESLYQRLADKEVGWEFTDQEEVAIMDMRLGMEKSFLFGARSRIELAATGDEVFLTGGISEPDRQHLHLLPCRFRRDRHCQARPKSLHRTLRIGPQSTDSRLRTNRSPQHLQSRPHRKRHREENHLGHRLPPHSHQIRHPLRAPLRSLRPMRNA